MMRTGMASRGSCAAGDGSFVATRRSTTALHRVASRGRRRASSGRPVARVLSLLACVLIGALYAAPAFAALELLIDENGAGPVEELGTPYGIVWDPVGNRAVVPSYENSLVFAVTAIGPGVYQKQVLIDATGDGVHALDGPWGVAVGPDGAVYVSGDNSHNVFKITQAGAISQIVDSTAGGSGATLLSPREITVSQSTGRVYVAGHNSNNVLRIEPGGAVTKIIDSLGDGLGNSLAGPLGIAVDLNENVYVAGHFTNNVFKIDSDLNVSEVIDVTGDGQGNTLSRPWGVGITSQGEVVVAGHYSDNVLVRLGSGAVTEVLDASGDGSTTLFAPVGIATAVGGVVYVASSGSDAVFQIRPLQSPVVAVDATGDGQGNELIGPWAVAVDENGGILVTGVFSWNAFGGAAPVFEPLPGIVGRGATLLAMLMLGGGLRALRAR